ncbi:MAG: serine O-acetyltransferase, partial [Nitrospirales bacterium]
MFRLIKQDFRVVFERDPAATSRLEVILTYSGFHALLAYRLTHWLWTH